MNGHLLLLSSRKHLLFTSSLFHCLPSWNSRRAGHEHIWNRRFIQSVYQMPQNLGQEVRCRVTAEYASLFVINAVCYMPATIASPCVTQATTALSQSSANCKSCGDSYASRDSVSPRELVSQTPTTSMPKIQHADVKKGAVTPLTLKHQHPYPRHPPEEQQ